MKCSSRVFRKKVTFSFLLVSLIPNKTSIQISHIYCSISWPSCKFKWNNLGPFLTYISIVTLFCLKVSPDSCLLQLLLPKQSLVGHPLVPQTFPTKLWNLMGVSGLNHVIHTTIGHVVTVFVSASDHWPTYGEETSRMVFVRLLCELCM